VPLIEEMDANLHAYVETQPSGGSVNATHSQELMEAFGKEEVVVTQVNSQDEVMDAVYTVLKQPRHRRAQNRMKYELEKRKEAEELREVAREARELAEKLGLEPYDVNYWVVDHDEINRAVAYGGFQTRYPHWRWGMNYDKQRKQDRFTQARIYELVVNDDPCHAYLQVSNELADQKAVITHVEAHADFFANNRWFREFTEGFDAAANSRATPRA